MELTKDLNMRQETGFKSLVTPRTKNHLANSKVPNDRYVISSMVLSELAPIERTVWFPGATRVWGFGLR